MSAARLAETVRARAEAMTDAAIDLTGAAATTMRDNGELLCVLARVLEGKDVLRAFGAPGDWGYGTSIGNALLDALRSTPARGPAERLAEQVARLNPAAGEIGDGMLANLQLLAREVLEGGA